MTYTKRIVHIYYTCTIRLVVSISQFVLRFNDNYLRNGIWFMSLYTLSNKYTIKAIFMYIYNLYFVKK